VNFIYIRLCVAISQLIGHVGEKWKHFSYTIRTQAIHYAYLEIHRFSRYWDSIITSARNSPARVKVHGASRRAYTLAPRHYCVSWFACNARLVVFQNTQKNVVNLWLVLKKKKKKKQALLSRSMIIMPTIKILFNSKEELSSFKVVWL